MRKIFPNLLSRSIKNFSQTNRNLHVINNKQVFNNKYRGLTCQCHFRISHDSQVQVENQLIIPFKGYLTIRNSENMDLAFHTNTKIINTLIAKNSTVDQVKQLIKEKLNATDIQLLCDQAQLISGLTPFEALLDRNVFLIINNDYSIKVEGQLLRSAVPNQHIQSFRNLELPLVTRRDIENYCQRVNTWIEAKYGAGFENTTIKIPKNQAKKILIQSLLDPLQSTKRMLQKEEEFQKLYWQVQQLLDKKSLAVLQCSKMVRNRMSLGLVLILTNIVFIWSGTYIYYSWDIIEPVAYFVSSLAGIILCAGFFKIKRPFSLFNFKKYMIEKNMPEAMKKIGLDANELYAKKIHLAELEAQIKDYYLKQL